MTISAASRTPAVMALAGGTTSRQAVCLHHPPQAAGICLPSCAAAVAAAHVPQASGTRFAALDQPLLATRQGRPSKPKAPIRLMSFPSATVSAPDAFSERGGAALGLHRIMTNQATAGKKPRSGGERSAYHLKASVTRDVDRHFACQIVDGPIEQCHHVRIFVRGSSLNHMSFCRAVKNLNLAQMRLPAGSRATRSRASRRSTRLGISKLQLRDTTDRAATRQWRSPSLKWPCTQSFLLEMRLRASCRSSASPKGV